MLNVETAIVNSALWAAAGDAVGWISELTDSKGLARRAGSSTLFGPVKWKRKIGGISGVTVDLDIGTYSDDTQLRLSVCRAIRGDGTFDIEPFAKIELPVWLSYALGAGRGSKAAATNLTKRDVNWFSNFFTYNGDRSYVDAGGNGAAMRIQPHVWRRARQQGRPYLDDVVKDSVVTHGNMRGICGAVFHADCLAFVLSTGRMPGPTEWKTFVRGFVDIAQVVKLDVQLNRFWLDAWERSSGQSISDALLSTTNETMQYLDALSQVAWGVESTYAEVLENLDALSEERKGTGINTALAAAALAWDMRNVAPQDVLLRAANAIGSDTDTIGTMSGALVGAASEEAPSWPIQDADYIALEARRMTKLCLGQQCSSFNYPDLLEWQPPSNQSDALGKYGDELAISGFGQLEPVGKQWKSGEFVWQWFKLTFGQTILCKYRTEIKTEINKNLMPSTVATQPRNSTKEWSTKDHSKELSTLPLFSNQNSSLNRSKEIRHGVASYSEITNKKHERISTGMKAPSQEIAPQLGPAIAKSRSLDALTEIVIQSNFDPKTIGDCLLECANADDAVERAIAFSAILAKALTARKRRFSK